MTKDFQRLTIVSKLFTEDILKDVLVNVTGHEDVTVSGWTFGDGAGKGDNYLATVDKVTIDGIAGGKSVAVKVFVKSLPQNLGRRKTYRSTEFFYNEIIFYSKIAPMFEKFLKSKNETQLVRIPKCLSYVLDGENDFIVLEDVTVYGFLPITRQSTVSLEDCKVILSGMAHFHGVSFALKDQNEVEFYQAVDQLIETYYTEELWNWYKNYYTLLVNIAKDAVSKEYDGSPEAEKFMDVDARRLYDTCISFIKRNKCPTSVVNQGDAWQSNFLMRTVESTGEKEPLLLDFQLARCASPITDMSFFIYACTDKELRDKEFNNLLEHYYQELSNAITRLGSDPEKIYSRKQFMQEVKEQFLHGFAFSLESIPMSMLDENEAFDLDLIKDDKVYDIVDIWAVTPIKDQTRRRRLADVIIHAVQFGCLNSLI